MPHWTKFFAVRLHKTSVSKIQNLIKPNIQRCDLNPFYQFGCDSINRIEAHNPYVAMLSDFAIWFIPTKIPTIRKSTLWFWSGI